MRQNSARLTIGSINEMGILPLGSQPIVLRPNQVLIVRMGEPQKAVTMYMTEWWEA